MTLPRALYIPWAIVWSMFCFSGAFADSSEVWELRFLLAEAIIEVEHSGQEIHGVVLLKEPFRGIAPYHFNGRIEGDMVEASHSSGHSFRGKMINSMEVTGVLTTKTGIRLNLTAKRR